jgi:hypothetical protein
MVIKKTKSSDAFCKSNGGDLSLLKEEENCFGPPVGDYIQEDCSVRESSECQDVITSHLSREHTVKCELIIPK